MHLLIIFSTLLLQSCALLYSERTFMDEMSQEDTRFFKPGVDFQTMPGDVVEQTETYTMINERTPMSEKQKEKFLQYNSIKLELMTKENKLNSEEYDEYKRNERFFANDSEKIYYLNLSPQEKKQYVSIFKREFSDEEKNSSTLGIITNRNKDDDQSLTQGMNKNSILDKWGKPDRIDIAGNPRNENERWIYNINNKPKVIYLENGLVQGWELE